MANPVVQVEGGLIEGRMSEDGASKLFFGVPYAAPPVGDLRWRAPQPVIPWEGVKKTQFFGNVVPHIRGKKGGFYRDEFDVVDFPMSEDCLLLNIWVPAEGEGPWPVALYSHGGDSHATKWAFDGEGFAKHGVIMITYGFRTGLLSNMCTKELSKESEAETGHYTSGNYGLLDGVAAVKWIRRNIAQFGGDPDRITVFGQSAGGTQTQRLAMSPLLKGELFGAIMQSAGGMDPRYMSRECTLAEAEEFCENMLKSGGYNSIEEARNEDIMVLMKKFRMGPDEGMALAAHADGYSLAYSPDRSVKEGAYPDIHYMIGFTKHEGFATPRPWKTYEQYKAYLEHMYGEETAAEYLEKTYVKTDADVEFARLDDNGDLKMGAAMAMVDRMNSQGRPAPYVYMFTREVADPRPVGAFHSGEHAFVFQTYPKFNRNYNSKDQQLSEIMNSAWSNFMKTGNPNGEGIPQWNPCTDSESNPVVMEMGLRVGMMDLPETPAAKVIRKFCRDFYDK